MNGPDCMKKENKNYMSTGDMVLSVIRDVLAFFRKSR